MHTEPLFATIAMVAALAQDDGKLAGETCWATHSLSADLSADNHLESQSQLES